MPDTLPNDDVISPGPLDPAFAALLCCPVCDERPPLRLIREDDRETALACDRCGRVYPITDFPDLRPESGVLPGGEGAQSASGEAAE